MKTSLRKPKASVPIMVLYESLWVDAAHIVRFYHNRTLGASQSLYAGKHIFVSNTAVL